MARSVRSCRCSGVRLFPWLVLLRGGPLDRAGLARTDESISFRAASAPLLRSKSAVFRRLSFDFDRVFQPHHRTSELYRSVLRSAVVLPAVQGVHGSVLAYGQTSTGKTYTMQVRERCGGAGEAPDHPCAVRLPTAVRAPLLRARRSTPASFRWL